MIETYFNLKCDVCGAYFLPEAMHDDYADDAVRSLLIAAEAAGWKVYRLARDVYYGKAWCTACKPTKSIPSGPPSSGPN